MYILLSSSSRLKTLIEYETMSVRNKNTKLIVTCLCMGRQAISQTATLWFIQYRECEESYQGPEATPRVSSSEVRED